MSWYDSVLDTVGGWFSGDSKVGTSLINGALALYGNSQKNSAIDSTMNALKNSSSASEASYNDYVDYLNALAQWQQQNPSGSGYGYSYGRGVSYPYAGQIQSLIKDLEPYKKIGLKQTKKTTKAFNKALKELNANGLGYDVIPSYAVDTGIEKFKK